MDNERVATLATLKRQVGFWIAQGRKLRAAINRSADAVAEAIGGGDVDASPTMHVIDLVAPGKRCRVRLRRSDGSKVTSEAFITCVAVVEPRQESIPWRLSTDSFSRPDRKAPGITDPGEVTVTFKLSGKPIEGE